MTEPYQEAEQRELAWDRYCDTLAHCSACGTAIMPDEPMLEYGEYILCMSCVDYYTHYQEV